MSVIKKFKIQSPNPEEMEFKVSRIRVTTITESYDTMVDEDGNPISQIERPTVNVKEEVREGISKAIAMPSRTPAGVEILETESIDKEYVDDPADPSKPFRIDRFTTAGNPNAPVLNLTRALDPDGPLKPIVIKPTETVWADKE